MYESVYGVVEPLSGIPIDILLCCSVLVFFVLVWFAGHNFVKGKLFKTALCCCIIANAVVLVMEILVVKYDKMSRTAQDVVMYLDCTEIISEDSNTQYVTRYKDDAGGIWLIDDYNLFSESKEVLDCKVYTLDDKMYIECDGVKYKNFTHTSEYNVKEIY